MSLLGDELREAIERVTAPDVYKRAHAATVRTQHDDGTIDVDVDHPSIKTLSNCPLRVGIVGARVLVPEGTRLAISFENGDPDKYYAHGIDQDPDAARGVARMDDEVHGGWLLGIASPGGGPITWTYFPADTVPPPPPMPGLIELRKGLIKTASEEVFLRD